MSQKDPGTTHGRWAEFRFGVIGSLFSAPPGRGMLECALTALAEQCWVHPISGEPTRFAASTIARWYYAARNQPKDRLGALRPRVRADRGQHRPVFCQALWEALAAQYAEHPSWTYRLHSDNLWARCEKNSKLGPAPSYATVRRHMKSQGWLRREQRRDDHRPQAQEARNRRAARESRGWEKSHVHALWHLDFKDGPLPVLTRSGEYKHPQAFGVLDNRSRLGCHLQWYLGEGVEELCHGLGQALMKRGKPAGIMMDNGSAMKAGELRQGLLDLGIQLVEIPDYTPEHNAIIEAFWKQIVLRLLPMLESVRDLTLGLLNEATLAFLEFEYNCTVISVKVPWSNLPLSASTLNLIKMVAFQAESDLLALLRSHYARCEDEGRTLLHELLGAVADIDFTQVELVVTIHPLSSPHRTLAAQALCDALTRTETAFPGTNLKLRYVVHRRPQLGLAFPGPRQTPGTTLA